MCVCVPLMAIIKHTHPTSLTAFSSTHRDCIFWLAVNWSGLIQKESQPLMKRQYPGERQNYAKFSRDSKYGGKRSSAEWKHFLKNQGRGRLCGPWQIWKIVRWLSNKWPNILMWERCVHVGQCAKPSVICCLCHYIVSMWSHLAASQGYRAILVPVPF